ncbi:MAG: DinB family protein [Thermoanaerobaculia bacterium]
MPLTAAEREDLIRRYEHGPALLRAALEKVPREAHKWRPADDKWSVHEIVCHCADSETNAASRIRYLVAEKKPVIVGYDQDLWAKTFVYHAANLYTALGVVEAVRAHTAELLARLPGSAWLATGTHTESGAYGADDWLKVYAEHLEKHSRQIERNLRAWQAEETRPTRP